MSESNENGNVTFTGVDPVFGLSDKKAAYLKECELDKAVHLAELTEQLKLFLDEVYRRPPNADFGEQSSIRFTFMCTGWGSLAEEPLFDVMTREAHERHR